MLQGDPYGLSPIAPTVAQLPGGEPYLMSNTITAFSVMDTGTGMVDSYYFDTSNPDSEVVHFDSFAISAQGEAPLEEKQRSGKAWPDIPPAIPIRTAVWQRSFPTMQIMKNSM